MADPIMAEKALYFEIKRKNFEQIFSSFLFKTFSKKKIYIYLADPIVSKKIKHHRKQQVVPIKG